MMILLPMATYILGNAVAARFAHRLGSLRLLLSGRAIAVVGAVALALWGGSGELSVWLLFAPIAFTEIGDGMSQPAGMPARLSTQPRPARTASALVAVPPM